MEARPLRTIPTLSPEQLVSLLKERLETAGRLSLLFDYDGTLADIVADPPLATIDDATRDALKALSRGPRIRVGIITGRSRDSLLEAAGDLHGIALAANGGLRVIDPNGEWIHPEAEALVPRLGRLAEALRRDAAKHPGAWVEDKQLSLAVHFRNAPQAEEALREAVGERLAREAGAFLAIPGKAIFEVQPAIAWDKGRAAAVLLERWGDGHPFFAGDDVIDEPAFAVVRERSGTTCLVDGAGSNDDRATWATVRVRDPSGCRDLVRRLAEVLDGP